MTDPAPARSRARAVSSAARRPDLAVVLEVAPLPVLRLLPAPDCEPPYDDELVGAAPPRTLPPDTIGRPGLRLVTPPARGALPVPGGQADRVPVEGGLPAARPFAVALVHRLIEVRGGVRPVLQLQRDTTPGLYADLERGLHRRARATGTRPGSGDVRSVHVQERADGVAEVCATVRRGSRMGALALRLEAAGGRWLCTQVQGL